VREKKKARTERYCGELTPAQAASGIAASMKNARQLVAEGDLLLKAGHHARAGSLGILALEEAGKAAVIMDILVASTPETLKAHWQRFRSHTAKVVFAEMTDVARTAIAQGRLQLPDFERIFNFDNPVPPRLDDLKQGGFYVDCTGAGDWTVPESRMSADLAEFIIGRARELSETKYPFTSEAELSVWKRHLHGNDDHAAGLAACIEELKAKEMLSEEDAQLMLTFLSPPSTEAISEPPKADGP
jgi:AbiV family abortive infection protein